MNALEAMTRRDRWVPIMWSTGVRRWRVGRVLDDRDTVQWHRCVMRYPATHFGPVITFRILAHAEARAAELNLADAEAVRREGTS